MRSYQLTLEAARDLDEIVEHFDEGGRTAANRILDAIEAKCRALAAMSGMGRLREELAPGLRSSLAGRHLIFYRERDDGIDVVRIIHGNRDIPKQFD